MTRSQTSTDEATARTSLAKYIPGALGAACVVAGVSFIWWPLGLIALGAFLLLVDRRLG